MRRRLIIELGHGIDQHGQDSTRAARRAVKDAISRSYLVGLREIFALEDLHAIHVDVTVAVPYPDTVNGEEVLQVIPFGQKSINIEQGGLAFPGVAMAELGDRSPDIYMANAAVVVSIDN